MIGLRRMRVDQPSTTQDWHHLHGLNVLAVPYNAVPATQYPLYWRIYFLSGPVESQVIPGRALSKGWNEK